jgi:uroporphyrinogen III methyltransferase/synthase
VYLVGAGPGDPGLITVKGSRLLAGCDTVVFDTLANPALLDLAPEAAERIDVGKKPGAAPVPQPEITARLIALARQGRRVVRLKGGDPFVFGRGGEEAIGLAEAGVPFEVVPGVTAAVGASAYAGIPITHRGVTSTFALITGHEDPARELSGIDWTALARIGTLAFYMGVRNLPAISQRLIAAGMDPATPAAVIQAGTYPRQRTVTGTVADLPRLADEAGIRRPAMTVVGPTVALRERMRWFDRLPLFGRTVLVTRTREQASGLSELLRELGAEPVEAPVIRVLPPADPRRFDEAVRSAGRFDWVVFTSVNGVEAFFRRLDALGLDVRTLGTAKLAAIGPATAAALTARHLRTALTPGRYIAEAVLEELAARGEVAGRRFLLPRADIARDALPVGLRDGGAAEVAVVDAYRTVPAERLPERAVELLREGRVDWVTFTSSSTASHFADLAGPELLARATATARFASIGPITSATARQRGLPVHVEAAEHTIPGLVAAMVSADGPRP